MKLIRLSDRYPVVSLPDHGWYVSGSPGGVTTLVVPGCEPGLILTEAELTALQAAVHPRAIGAPAADPLAHLQHRAVIVVGLAQRARFTGGKVRHSRLRAAGSELAHLLVEQGSDARL